jgi:anti-anti-sigma factor
MSTILHSESKKDWNILIEYLEWEIDETNSTELKEIINNFIISKSTKLILNIKHLDYINSMIIWWLVNCLSDFRAVNKTIVFSEANDDIYNILNLVWLTEVIKSYSSDKEALTMLKLEE